LRIGLHVGDFSWSDDPAQIGETFGWVVEQAEAAGFDSFWPMDHLFQIGMNGPPEEPMLESWTTLAFVAGRTQRMRLGTLVSGVAYRHPGILVKMATTVDVLSGGRAYLGIGATWNEDEARGLGIPFPPLAERFERLEETLRIAHQMWDGDERPFEGRHYQLTRPLNSPQSVQRPRPPILIGGGGERKTLRLVARYGDACNLFPDRGRDLLLHKLEVLRGHCEAVGRPYEAIERTVTDHLRLSRDGREGTMTPEAAVEYFAGLAEAGIDHAIVMLPDTTDPAVYEMLGSTVIPEVKRLRVAGR
jgi:F420-dependent oxidoreductase-like protein